MQSQIYKILQLNCIVAQVICYRNKGGGVIQTFSHVKYFFKHSANLYSFVSPLKRKSGLSFILSIKKKKAMPCKGLTKIKSLINDDSLIIIYFEVNIGIFKHAFHHIIINTIAFLNITNIHMSKNDKIVSYN